jgi:hypothetical protein
MGKKGERESRLNLCSLTLFLVPTSMRSKGSIVDIATGYVLDD